MTFQNWRDKYELTREAGCAAIKTRRELRHTDKSVKGQRIKCQGFCGAVANSEETVRVYFWNFAAACFSLECAKGAKGRTESGEKRKEN